MSGDAEHITAGRKDGEGALLAMKNAFSQIGKDSVGDLWAVNAHATSTPLGDLAEVTALEKLLQNHSSFKPFLTSNKGSIGHLLGAAGSVETIFAILGLTEATLPKNANLKHLKDCATDKLNILQETFISDKDTSKRKLVLKNSFGFGGTNVSLLFSNLVK